MSIPASTNESRAATNKTARSGVHSMTGFARINGRLSDAVGFTLSLKSVNHRFLDLQFRMPPGSDGLEMQLRGLLKQRLARGHVDVTLSLDCGQRDDACTSAVYDAALVAGYIAAFRKLAVEHGLTCQPDLNAILLLPGIFATDSRTAPEHRSNEEAQALEAAVLREIEPLVESLTVMRAREGELLAQEMLAALDRLRALVDEAMALRKDVQHAYFERISQRVSAMVGDSFDRDRVLQEAAMMAERSDVDEEVTRLRTHIDHFRAMLKNGGEIGKKLDFLMQEMNREANTLLSKTGGIAGSAQQVTELGLSMKSEIEKLREQVQNIE